MDIKEKTITMKPQKFTGYNLSIWHRPDPLVDPKTNIKIPRYAHRYLVSADTGGVWDGADWSEAYVFDRLMNRVCANVHVHVSPYVYADQLIMLCKHYERAHLVVEINKYASEVDDQGETVISFIKDKYDNLYTHRVKDDETKEYTHKIGFHTNAQTKGMVVDALHNFVNEWDGNPTICQDKEFIEQMRTYVYLQTKTGKTTWGASEGEKDDKVMAFGIMLLVSKEMPPVQEIKDYEVKLREPEDIMEMIAG